MATCGISSVESQKKSRSISSALASAVLEWLLIFMLFIDAIFSYLITKFSSHWELQSPCLLCSRLDRILGNKNLRYYRDIICGNHKLEISSLVFCYAHNKLVDVHGLCEICLFSFATINKSNAETYRLLVGKLGEDSSFGLGEDPLSDGQNSTTRLCSCCNEPWAPRACNQKLIQLKSVGSEAADLDVALSGVVEYDQDIVKKGKRTVPVRTNHQGAIGHGSLSHVQYSKLKINSDTESEVHFSDNDEDDANALFYEKDQKDDVALGSVQPEQRIITLPNDRPSDRLINPISETESAILVSRLQSDAIVNQDPAAAASGASIGHGLDELNWREDDPEARPSIPPELISFDEVISSSLTIESPVDAPKESKVISLAEVPSSSDAREIPFEELEERKPIPADEFPPSDARECALEASEEIKLISVDDVLPLADTRETRTLETKLNSVVDDLSSGLETPVRGLKESCVGNTEEVFAPSASDCEEISKEESQPGTTSETASEANLVSGDNGLQIRNSLDLSDAYKLAVGNKARPLSGVLAEQWTGKDSLRISEDLKLVYSQLSAAREQSMNDTSPRVPISPRVAMSPKLSLNSDEIRASDACSTTGMQILQKRISIERNESGLSLDGSIITDIEGESIVDRLKRQLEHDKKLLSALYKELEEERNASAVATNQAMAMITRLQEEKATLHMEALQCLRMMEEQAEYDMEALQKTNDLLAEREKVVQDLEAELEFYRNKFPNESVLQDPVEKILDMKTTDMDHSKASYMEDATSIQKNCVTCKPDVGHKVEGTHMFSGDTNITTTDSSTFELEEERVNILRSLKKLKRKFYLSTNNRLFSDLVNGEYCRNEENREDQLKEPNSKLGQGSVVQDTDVSLESNRENESLEKYELNGIENTETIYSSQTSPLRSGESDLDSLANEVSDLNKRLEALKADQNFLERIVNSIRCGEEGLQFVQEIATQLKELRSIESKGREQSIA